MNREERLRKFIELLRSDAATGGSVVVRGWVVRRLEQILDETPSDAVALDALRATLRRKVLSWEGEADDKPYVTGTDFDRGYRGAKGHAAKELTEILDKRREGSRRIPNPNYSPPLVDTTPGRPPVRDAAPRTARDFGALIAADAEYPDVVLPGGRRVPIKPGAHLRVWVEGGKLHHEVTEELE